MFPLSPPYLGDPDGTGVTAEVLQTHDGRGVAHVQAGSLVVYVHPTGDDTLTVELHTRNDQAREQLRLVLDGTPLTIEETDKTCTGTCG